MNRMFWLPAAVFFVPACSPPEPTPNWHDAVRYVVVASGARKDLNAAADHLEAEGIACGSDDAEYGKGELSVSPKNKARALEILEKGIADGKYKIMIVK